jgi:3-dehydroquinate synthase
MGEVIKYACFEDATLFNTLKSAGNFEALKPQLTEIIARCIDIKRKYVEADPFDKGERMKLNFGHTLAHAIEQYFHYEKYSHGEAVAIGMYQITKISELLELTKGSTAEQIKALLVAYDLPYESGLTLGELLESVKLDKKNLDGILHVILLNEIGDCKISGLDYHLLEQYKELKV